MLLSDSIISPTNNVVDFHSNGLLLRTIYEDAELRRLVPQVDDMLGDIRATHKIRQEADPHGEDLPE